ncbi:MAG TPA: VOC family protein, partial [Acidimicrobiales bacterium]|nr:VOC family protein [Acidimicrobiales bacterium]
MAFHHVAVATNDLDATHRFYTEVMGFTLVKTVASPTGAPGGAWAKHLFYDTGAGGLIAFW